MSAQDNNVAAFTGSQLEAPDPHLQAEAAMSEAIAEIEHADGNARTVAQLLEAREAIRAEYRARHKSGDESEDAAIADRVRRVFKTSPDALGAPHCQDSCPLNGC